MKSLKYLLSVLAGVAVYVLISVSCGRNGMWAARQMSEQKRLISANTQTIQNINEELKLEKTAIRDDKEVIAAFARRMDYVSDGEKLVKIKGLGPAKDLKYETGTVLKRKTVLYIPEWACKASGLLVGTLALILTLLYDISYGNISFKKQHYEVIQGIPVYEVSQI